MPMSHPAVTKPWVLVASEGAIAQLAPLIDYHRQVGPVRVVPTLPGSAIAPSTWQDAAAILWVDTAQRSPRTGIPAWFLAGPQRQKIPVGWLPHRLEALSTYAQAAATIGQRALNGALPGPLALLGSRDDRTLSLLDLLETDFHGDHALKFSLGRAQGQPLPVYRWSAERLPRGDLLYALGLGLGAALYLGHGFPTGWHSYAGLNQSHLSEWQGDPLGTLFCITCHNASRHQTPLSFAETLVLSGRCGTVLAATGKTSHRVNQQFALRLIQAIQARLGNDQPLTLAACLQHPLIAHLPLQRYRILGDPTLPMTGSLAAHPAATMIDAPAPEASLMPLSPALWQGLVDPVGRS